KPSSKPRRSQDSSEEPKPKRGRINRKSLDGENSRFVQSYSIFEMGVGCVVKTDNHSVELRMFYLSYLLVASSSRVSLLVEFKMTKLSGDAFCGIALQSSSGRSVKKVLNDEAPSTSAVALPTAPCPRPEPFVTDVSQFFSFPPTFMPPDSPTRSPGDPSSPVKNAGPVSKAKSCASVIPSQLFDGTSSTGSLFTLRIPEVFLSEDSPIMKEGKFGKIQLLDNGEARLVVSDAAFQLLCPKPTTYSSDVVLVEDQEDGVVCLDSLGHIDQCVTAVPDLQRFSDLGR
ncbi:unnamed protein product, partial [Mesocestoides corti]